MSIKFTTFDDYFQDFHPHILLYAFNGVGKTTIVGKTGLRTVLLDCGDAGIATLRKTDRSKLKIVRVKSTEHYCDVMVELTRRASQIDLLVPDTVTGLQSMAIREVKKKGEMNQRKWGQVTSRVIECLFETQQFPKDVIYLAQEKRKKKSADDTGFETYGPSLTPSVREYLSGNIDWIGRIFIEDDKRKLSFLLTDEVEAKDRGDLFPKIIKLPEPKLIYTGIRKRIVEGILGA